MGIVPTLMGLLRLRKGARFLSSGMVHGAESGRPPARAYLRVRRDAHLRFTAPRKRQVARAPPTVAQCARSLAAGGSVRGARTLARSAIMVVSSW